MITVNPVKLNNTKVITFGEGNLNNITPSVAILSLQNPNAKINFENDLNRTKKADMVQNHNILSALANKAVKAFDILKGKTNDNNNNVIDRHIAYMA